MALLQPLADLVLKLALRYLVDHARRPRAAGAELVGALGQAGDVGPDCLADRGVHDVAQGGGAGNGVTAAPMLRAVGQDEGLTARHQTALRQRPAPILAAGGMPAVLVQVHPMVDAQERARRHAQAAGQGSLLGRRNIGGDLIVVPDVLGLSPGEGPRCRPRRRE